MALNTKELKEIVSKIKKEIYEAVKSGDKDYINELDEELEYFIKRIQELRESKLKRLLK